MRLSKAQTWIGGTALVCVLIVVAGWFLLITPQRAEAADLRDQTVSAAQVNSQMEQRIAQLKADFAELPKHEAELAAIRLAMPEDPQLAALTRDLQALSTSSGVTLMSIAPGGLTAVLSPAPVAPAAAPDPAAAGSDASDPAAGTGVNPGLSELPVSVDVVGSFEAAEAFLDGLQTDIARRYLVDGLTVVAEKPSAAAAGKPAVGNGDVTFTVTGRVFVLQSADGTGTTPSTTTTAGTAGTVNN